MPQAYLTFARQIFHIEDISLVSQERISLKKALAIASAFFWLRATKKMFSCICCMDLNSHITNRLIFDTFPLSFL